MTLVNFKYKLGMVVASELEWAQKAEALGHGVILDADLKPLNPTVVVETEEEIIDNILEQEAIDEAVEDMLNDDEVEEIEEVKEEVKEEKNEVDSLSYKELQAKAKELKINPFGKKQEVLLDEVKKAMKE